MSDLVIGLGEVGKSVREVVGADYCLDAAATLLTEPPAGARIDVMHICFPYSDAFVEHVRDYMDKFRPKHVVVWSTVPIGTCRKISSKVVHSPVEGKHPHLAESIRKMTRWIGYNRGSEGRFFEEYFKELGFRTTVVDKTEATELYKLRSTAKYGINIVFAQYEAELCEKYGVSYVDLMQFDCDYNDLYTELGLPDYRRYVLYQPDGEIGGHCVVPNAKLLNEQAPSDLLDKIISMEPKNGS